MSRIAVSRWIVALAVVMAGRDLAGQEFSVYTRVFESAATDGPQPPVGRSLSLFHAGKVYDYVENERDGEVVIYEPALERFRILSTTRALWTTVHVDQLHHKLKLARGVVEQHLARLERQEPPAAPQSIAELRFILAPPLHESFDAGQNTLTLSHPLLTYRAVCARSGTDQPSPELVAAYLRYADAAARMNYILHPHAIGPEPRLALNAALRQRGRIPIQVELRSRIGGDVQLRAEHKFHWQLEARDRSLIHEWETRMSGEQARHVTLDEYQRVLLGRAQAAGAKR
jgi:hypothetical protein